MYSAGGGNVECSKVILLCLKLMTSLMMHKEELSQVPSESSMWSLRLKIDKIMSKYATFSEPENF